MGSSLRFWLKEATVFPINNENLAINYLTEFYGGNIVPNSFIKEKISKGCLKDLLEQGRFTIKEDGWYSYR